MIYFLAVILSFVAAVMSFLSEITASNIRHLNNGREPNAGAAIFPTIPLLPLLAIGTAWLLRHFFPAHATWLLVGGFFLFGCLWGVAFTRLRIRFRRLNASHDHPKQS